MEKIKLSPEEMGQINMIQNRNREIMFKFGQIEVSLIQLQKAKIEVSGELDKNIEDERQLAEQFRTKYGNGDINLETGEFTPVS
jgi:hypothetical protein